MNNQQLKADKDRVLTELNFIKEEFFRAPEFALEELESFGFNISTDGRITIKTPGGYFRFKIENIERIIELVEAHYPRGGTVLKKVRVLSSSKLYFPMDEPDNIHNFVTALKSGNKGLIALFAKALDAGQVARFTKDAANA